MTNSEYKPGDYVVGRYSENGAKIKDGKLVGDSDEVAELKSMLSDHAKRTGGQPLKSEVVPAKKVAKKKAKPSNIIPMPTMGFDEEPPFEPEPDYKPTIKKSKKQISFLSQMGKIKMTIEDIIECEMAFCIIFSEEDDIIFSPKSGETLTMITPEGNEHQVYFSNTVFTWVDGTKQLMVLFKIDDE
jgi:hypothetical protein